MKYFDTFPPSLFLHHCSFYSNTMTVSQAGSECIRTLRHIASLLNTVAHWPVTNLLTRCSLLKGVLRQLADRHLADRHLADRHLADRHLTNTTFGRHDKSPPLQKHSSTHSTIPPKHCLSAKCLSAKSRFGQVPVGQLSVGQISCLPNVMSAKCRIGEISCRPNFCRPNVVSAKFHVGQMYVGQMSCWPTFMSAKFRLGEISSLPNVCRPNVVSAKFCVGQMSCRPNVCRPTAVAPLELSNILIQSLPLSHRYDKKYYFRKRRVSVERKFRCYSTQ